MNIAKLGRMPNRPTFPSSRHSFLQFGLVITLFFGVAKSTWAAVESQATAGPRPQMALPAMGELVPLDRIHEICTFYGLNDLWRKIERDPPSRPFKSDGCTGWFDDWQGVSLYPAGFLHDLKYWAGYPGEEVERLVADAELMIDVARLLNSTTMAETMFHGVRLGGSDKLHTSFSWAFGRESLEAKANGK